MARQIVAKDEKGRPKVVKRTGKGVSPNSGIVEKTKILSNYEQLLGHVPEDWREKLRGLAA